MNISAHTTRCRALLALLFMPALSLTAQPTPVPAAPFDVPLYAGAPTGAPLSTKAEVFVQAAGDPIARITHVQTPDMRVFLPSATTATGTAIVIFPGGGYGILAIDHEGWAVARWLTAQGIAAIVVKYRVSDTEGERYRFPVPLLDARQALRVVRERAAGWGIDPTRVGVMGFSAGGHLTSMLLTTFNDALPGERVATIDSLRIRPDFGVLVYPVITLHEPWGHRGSSDNLFGASATQERRQQYSSERRVTAATPPTFLVATQDDQAVPVQNSIAFYQAMTAQRVAGELHVWERGGHGFGMLAAQGPVATEWLPRLVDWMRGRGLLRRARDT